MKNINFKIAGFFILALTVLSVVLFGADTVYTLTQAGLSSPESLIAFASAGMMITPSEDDQDHYTFKQFLASKGLGGTSAQRPVITKTALRIEQKLSPASGTQYVFDLKQSINTDRPLERKLKSTEFFMVTAIALGIQKQEVNAGGTQGLNQANFPLMTYADPNYFIGNAAAVNNEARALENLYNGNISVKVGSTTLQESLSTRFMKYVPMQQFVNKAVSGQVAHTYPSYGALIEEEGYFRIHSKPVFAGNDTNELILDIGNANRDDISGGADVDGRDTENIAVLQLYGFLYAGVVGAGACELR